MEVGHKYAVDHMSQIKVRMRVLRSLLDRLVFKILIVEGSRILSLISTLLLLLSCHLALSPIGQRVIDSGRGIRLTGPSIQEREVGKLLLVNHMNSTVKHYGASANLSNYTAAAYILPSTQGYNLNWHIKKLK